MPSRREALLLGAKLAAGAAALGPTKVFGARPQSAQSSTSGSSAASATTSRVFDAAASAGTPTNSARVLLRGARKYLTGTLVLRGGIDFHLADDAELRVSTQQADYTAAAVLTALETKGLRISGTGSVNGRGTEFMAAAPVSTGRLRRS